MKKFIDFVLKILVEELGTEEEKAAKMLSFGKESIVLFFMQAQKEENQLTAARACASIIQLHFTAHFWLLDKLNEKYIGEKYE